jgi:hypothetical protein
VRANTILGFHRPRPVLKLLHDMMRVNKTVRDYTRSGVLDDEEADVIKLSKAIQQLGQSLVCPICQSFARDPTKTKCQHSFCKDCLTRALSLKQACPVCKMDCRKRETRPDDMMEQLLAEFKELHPPKLSASDEQGEGRAGIAYDNNCLTQVESLSQLVQGLGANPDRLFPRDREVEALHELEPLEARRRSREQRARMLLRLVDSEEELDSEDEDDLFDPQRRGWATARARAAEPERLPAEARREDVEDEDARADAGAATGRAEMSAANAVSVAAAAPSAGTAAVAGTGSGALPAAGAAANAAADAAATAGAVCEYFGNVVATAAMTSATEAAVPVNTAASPGPVSDVVGSENTPGVDASSTSRQVHHHQQQPLSTGDAADLLANMSHMDALRTPVMSRAPGAPTPPATVVLSTASEIETGHKSSLKSALGRSRSGEDGEERVKRTRFADCAQDVPPCRIFDDDALASQAALEHTKGSEGDDSMPEPEAVSFARSVPAPEPEPPLETNGPTVSAVKGSSQSSRLPSESTTRTPCESSPPPVMLTPRSDPGKKRLAGEESDEESVEDQRIAQPERCPLGELTRVAASRSVPPPPKRQLSPAREPDTPLTPLKKRSLSRRRRSAPEPFSEQPPPPPPPQQLLQQQQQQQHSAPGSETLTEPAPRVFRVGDLVTVSRRMYPGANKPGGAGRIVKVLPGGLYNVKYDVLGTSEKYVSWQDMIPGLQIDASCFFGGGVSFATLASSSSTTSPVFGSSSSSSSSSSTSSRERTEERRNSCGSLASSASIRIDKGSNCVSHVGESNLVGEQDQNAVRPGRAVVVMLTGFKDYRKNELERAVDALGGVVDDDDLDRATHVVVECGREPEAGGVAATRTLKYVRAVAAGKWIVRPEWLVRSGEHGRFLDPEPFEVEADVKSLHLGTGGPRRARRAVDTAAAAATAAAIAAADNPAITPPGGEPPLLLTGHSVFLLGAFEPPRLGADQVADLVARCGGKLLLDSIGLETTLAFSERVVVLTHGAEAAVKDKNWLRLSRLLCTAKVRTLDVQWLLNSISLYRLQRARDYRVDLGKIAQQAH